MKDSSHRRMKLFVASHSQESAKSLLGELTKLGHTVTSRWITGDAKFSLGLSAYSDDDKKQIALMDEEDVRLATDGLILIAEEKGKLVPGGKHVEMGIALALNRPVYVIGHRENIFQWHPLVRHYSSVGDY